MEGSEGDSNSPAPFLMKTYEMVDDASTNSIVSWSPASTSFIVWNPPEFARDLLPKYFKHNNFSSFVRQLNTYGFKKIDPEQWEFANENFIRGKRHLLKNIYRRKPVHSHSLQNQVNYALLAEADRKELKEQIKRLKHDKCMLMSELQNQMQQQYGMEQHMQSLEEKLHVLEERQRHLMTYLRKMIRRPGFLDAFLQQSDLQSKRRRLPIANNSSQDIIMETNGNIRLETTAREQLDGLSIHLLDMEPLEKMESSLNSLENFFRSVSQASGDDMYFDNNLHCLLSSVTLMEMHMSSDETDVNIPPSSPKQCSLPALQDVRSSPEIAESTTIVESHIPTTEMNMDTQSKVSEIDVNSEPVVHEVDSSREQITASTASAAAPCVNDGFWEQFLTETPGSSDPQEVQSERRDSGEQRFERKNGGHGIIWWSRKNNEKATQMGNLASAEKT